MTLNTLAERVNLFLAREHRKLISIQLPIVTSPRATRCGGAFFDSRRGLLRNRIIVVLFFGFGSLSLLADQDIGLRYPFEGDDANAVVISSVTTTQPVEDVNDPKVGGETIAKPLLLVNIKEGPGWSGISGAEDWGFFPAMEGSYEKGGNKGFKDTDSAQCAVKWTKAKKEVGHATNAKDQGKRKCGADWKRTNTEMGKREIQWETPIPESATHVEIVLVFTDMLFDTNGHRDYADPAERTEAGGCAWRHRIVVRRSRRRREVDIYQE